MTVGELLQLSLSNLFDFKQHRSVQLNLIQTRILGNTEYILISIKTPLTGLQFVKCHCKLVLIFVSALPTEKDSRGN